MATHYGGIGDTSMNNPESHNMDSDSMDYQEDVNDLEHIELNPPVELKHLTREMERFKTNCRGQGQCSYGCHKALGTKT